MSDQEVPQPGEGQSSVNRQIDWVCPDDMSLHGADRARDFLAIPFS